MKLIKVMGVIFLLTLLAGCAKVPNVPLSSTFWKNHHQSVTVATNQIPRAQLYQEGSEGLLDLAINSIATHRFARYLNNMNLSSLKALAPKFANALKAKGIASTVHARSINTKQLKRSDENNKKYALLNYTPLYNVVGKDKLLIINIGAIGATRRYYSFIPIGGPKAICTLQGSLVNLRNNQILWRYNTTVVIPVKGRWDVPQFPAFTRALKKAINIAKQELYDNFMASN